MVREGEFLLIGESLVRKEERGRMKSGDEEWGGKGGNRR